MRLIELPRTTSFRLAIQFLLLFGTASLVLFGFLYWETKGYLGSRVDNWLAREQAAFMHQDNEGRLERLAAHVAIDLTLERPFTLFDGSGQRVAGSPLSLSPQMWSSLPLDHPFEFTHHQSGEVITFRGLAHRMESGEVLLIAQDMRAAHNFDGVLIKAFISGSAVTIMLGLLGAAIAGADTVRRIDAVTRATQRIINGDLSGRLPTRGRSSDLDRLVHVINDMLGEIERLVQEVKGVCDNVAHDLRTPLTRLLAGLERARRRSDSVEEYAGAVDELMLEIKGVLRTFAALLRISEVENGARRAGFTTVDLSEVVVDAVEFYEPIAEEKGISLRLVSTDAQTMMRGDSSLLFEAVGNLLDNALKFTPRGGEITVRTLATNGRLSVEVSDTDPGIPQNERDAVMRRFYRAEESRHTPGSGLGLTLVSAVARLHGMDLTIADTASGCRITIAQQDRPEVTSDGVRERSSLLPA